MKKEECDIMREKKYEEISEAQIAVHWQEEQYFTLRRNLLPRQI